MVKQTIMLRSPRRMNLTISMPKCFLVDVARQKSRTIFVGSPRRRNLGIETNVRAVELSPSELAQWVIGHSAWIPFA